MRLKPAESNESAARRPCSVGSMPVPSSLRACLLALALLALCAAPASAHHRAWHAGGPPGSSEEASDDEVAEDLVPGRPVWWPADEEDGDEIEDARDGQGARQVRAPAARPTCGLPGCPTGDSSP